MQKNRIIIFILYLCSLVHGIYADEILSKQKQDPTQVGKWVVDSSTWEQSQWFDTKNFITFANRTQIEKNLKTHKNFTDTFFTTEDGYTLHGLWRKAEHADFTIIFCAGWLPGKQTGMATFVEMMPQNCNILFFNGRGKGNSTGKLSLLNIFNYGVHEHKDVIAAIRHAHKLGEQKPIILHGICVGAYLAARAVCALTPTDRQGYNIKGLVIDSGFDSINSMAKSLPENRINCSIKPFFLKKLMHTMFGYARKLFYDPWMMRHEQKINISIPLPDAQVPVFFIHSDDDQDAPYKTIESLIDTTVKTIPQSRSWLIHYDQKENSKGHHGVHHLKHKYEYCARLLEFIQNITQKVTETT